MLDKDSYFLSYSQRFTSINVPKARLPTAGTTASNEIVANRDNSITKQLHYTKLTFLSANALSPILSQTLLFFYNLFRAVVCW